ncbi:hypothetical protein XAP412_1310038 [Xanthomonas phaseoli pv. phaseoli]|nr:hypothetical protein XAP412_1310038 [Xanthomonas phaseoli pv. phaseoli]SON82974.1 hypothetical protein XAP7430_1310044 [Xanthomonas phaseoli pv. phaseoli]
MASVIRRSAPGRDALSRNTPSRGQVRSYDSAESRGVIRRNAPGRDGLARDTPSRGQVRSYDSGGIPRR